MAFLHPVKDPHHHAPPFPALETFAVLVKMTFFVLMSGHHHPLNLNIHTHYKCKVRQCLLSQPKKPKFDTFPGWLTLLIPIPINKSALNAAKTLFGVEFESD